MYTGSNVPPVAAVNAESIPSPPSDIGRHTVSMPFAFNTSAISSSTSCEDMQPLNESVASIYFMCMCFVTVQKYKKLFY